MDEIKMSELAVKKVKEVMEAEGKSPLEWGLRIVVDASSGCGISYGLDFDKVQEEDVVFTNDGLNIIVNKEFMPILQGSYIDYIIAPDGEGFVINNPNQGGGCGCSGCSCG